MKFDTVIIGGGLSGLMCGIKLSEKGKKCAIVSSGQSALHFFSGSFDLLNATPEENIVLHPLDSISRLVKLNPRHPYSKIGPDLCSSLAKEAYSFLEKAGVKLTGGNETNHYRLTPLGVLKPTWLSVRGFVTSDNGETFPWKRISVFNIAGFLDFYPKFIADKLEKDGIKVRMHTISLPALRTQRHNPSEMRSVNIARILDRKDVREELAEVLKEGSLDSDIVILPACIGLDSASVQDKLSVMIGKPVYLVSSFGPSVAGIRTQQLLCNHFRKLGGVYMLGDSVEKICFENKEVKVFTVNHGNIPLECEFAVLATGSFFSQGLSATRERIFEPVLNLDVDYETGRENWFCADFYETQAYQSYGVRTTDSFQAMKDGKVIDNLYVTGAILSGFNPIKEGSGGGVSLLSALYVADRILNREL